MHASWRRRTSRPMSRRRLGGSRHWPGWLRSVSVASVAVATLAALAISTPPAASALPAGSLAASSDIVTVSGNHLLRAGQPWVPKGVQLVGLLPGFPTPHQHFGQA